MKNEFAVVFVTCGSAKEARKIADRLLDKRLVACANIISGVESKFWWKEKIDKAAETLIMMKTLSKNFAKVEKEVRRFHSYEVPEIIAMPIVAGSRDYFRWISRSVKV